MDYYSILGVSSEAEDIVIRAAYKALAQRYHPDRCKGSAAEAHKRMAEINQAYIILSDPTSRNNYDKQRHKNEEQTPPTSNNKNSGNQNNEDATPEAIKGFSYGAFFLTFFWSISNRVWIGLLSIIPILGWIINIYLGLKGRELAWKAKSWPSLDNFNKYQKKWSIATFILFPAYVGLHVAIGISTYQMYVNNDKNASTTVIDRVQQAQTFEPLPANIRNQLQFNASETPVEAAFEGTPSVKTWLIEMDRRLAEKIPDKDYRLDFLKTVQYEAIRAGIDPELVLGIIEVGSNFRKYTVSTTSAQGYMQVMPFWIPKIGNSEHNLFHLRTNLRYGCVIFSHYLSVNNGDIFQALELYNSNPSIKDYPTSVYKAWRMHWTYGINQNIPS